MEKLIPIVPWYCANCGRDSTCSYQDQAPVHHCSHCQSATEWKRGNMKHLSNFSIEDRILGKKMFEFYVLCLAKQGTMTTSNTWGGLTAHDKVAWIMVAKKKRR